MSFEVHNHRRQAGRTLSGVTVARHSTGQITISMAPDAMPGIRKGDRIQIMIGRGQDRGKMALCRTTDGTGYTASPTGGKSGASLKVTFTPPAMLRDRLVYSRKAMHHFSDNVLTLSVPEHILDSLYPDAGDRVSRNIHR